MSKLSRGLLIGAVSVIACVVWIALASNVCSQPPEVFTPAVEPAPPANQTYTGAKACSSCHFKQFMSWKKTKHATDAWGKITAKYQADPACLKCHATGYGQATGFKDIASSANLAGTTCEACHGPGSEHDKIAKKYANKKKLDPAEEKEARDSIYKVLPGNVCAGCHAAQGHKDHPKYDK